MKLALLVGAVVAASVLLAAGIQYASVRRLSLAQAQARLEASAVRLGALADVGLAAGETERLTEAARSSAASEHLLSGSLVRADGKSLWREARGGYTGTQDDTAVRGVLVSSKAQRDETEAGGRRIIQWAVPLRARSEGATGAMGTRPLGVVLIAQFDAGEVEAEAAEAAAPAVQRMLLAGLASLGLGLLGATWVSASFTRTIKKLMQGAHEVGAGHFSVRVMTRRGDELGELSDQFNEMGVKLAELERLKDSFLAKITHDLRSPLGAIVCYADVMMMGLQGPLTEKQKNSLKLIVASGNDLAELVNNILDLTKLEAGKMSFTAADVQLKPLAQTVVDLLQVKASEFGVQFDATGIPEGTTLWADEQSLKRLLSNLLSNALKFTPEGGRVSLQWQRSDAGEDMIAVKDTGIGIPQDKIPTLFQKFSQVEETMHKVRFARGTGLGLAICREIAEGHGGRIWVESEYQKGSTFYVSLPKKKVAA